MPPIFFATTPDGAKRIISDLGPEQTRLYGLSETLDWCIDARSQAIDDNKDLSTSPRPVPGMDILSAMVVESANYGKTLMMADVDSRDALDQLERRIGSRIFTVQDKLAAFE